MTLLSQAARQCGEKGSRGRFAPRAPFGGLKFSCLSELSITEASDSQRKQRAAEAARGETRGEGLRECCHHVFPARTTRP
ncbi:hypothetical protein VULLAG_LOCUS14797 [Vulpes lagopus]